MTADALHCQREHVAYLAGRGAHWILMVKGNQPGLHQQLAGLPWRLVPVADRDTARWHGRREIRTLKILSISTGIAGVLPWKRSAPRPSQSRSPARLSATRGKQVRANGARYSLTGAPPAWSL
jgi:hypothetical protein